MAPEQGSLIVRRDGPNDPAMATLIFADLDFYEGHADNRAP
jgi:hypothetical protein